MGVLSSLLPGFRELRAPLAAGYLYLLTAWLLASDLVPRARPASGPLADLWDLGGIIGTTVVIAAVTFSAYLIGSFMEIDPQRLVASRGGYVDSERLSWMGRLLWYPKYLLAVFLPNFFRTQPLSRSGSADLDRLTAEAGIPAEYSRGAGFEVIEEMPQLATRLHVKNAEIYGRYDRLVAEGTFRLNVAIPLTLFLSILAFRAGLAWWLRTLLAATAVVFGFLLAQQGMRRVVAARDIVVQAISIPDLGLESRRLKDFRWRLESIRAAQEDLKPEQREAIVRVLRDRPDSVDTFIRLSPANGTDQKENPSDSELFGLFLSAVGTVKTILRSELGGDRYFVTMVDQVLRQLDQIGEGPPKRPDDKMPLSPG